MQSIEWYYKNYYINSALIFLSPLWSFSGVMKEIIQMDHNMVKSLNWWEANQVAILQVWLRIWTCNYREQNPASGQGRTWTRGLQDTSPAL